LGPDLAGKTEKAGKLYDPISHAIGKKTRGNVALGIIAMTQGLDAETTFIEGRIDRIFSPNDKITIQSLTELSTFFRNKLCVSLPKVS
jgi:hypothetical protein